MRACLVKARHRTQSPESDHIEFSETEIVLRALFQVVFSNWDKCLQNKLSKGLDLCSNPLHYMNVFKVESEGWSARVYWARGGTICYDAVPLGFAAFPLNWLCSCELWERFYGLTHMGPTDIHSDTKLSK